MNARTKSWMTPLYIACDNNQLETARALLDAGAKINKTCMKGKWTALHNAVEHGYPHILNLLLSKNADLNARCAKGETPLWMACGLGREVEARLLLAAGADPTIKDKTFACNALHMAACCGRSEIIPLIAAIFFNQKKYLDSKTDAGETPLFLACKYGQYNAAVALIASGASVAEKNGWDELTALHAVMKLEHPLAFVRMLLKNGAEVNARAIKGYTPLMYACLEGLGKVVITLVEAGADIEAETLTDRDTACFMAYWRGFKPIVSYLELQKALVKHSKKREENHCVADQQGSLNGE